MNKDASILITGSNGMVGRSLVSRLSFEGYQNLLTPSSTALDMRSQEAVRQFFYSHKIDCVIHLAGHIGGIGASVTYPVEFLYENMIMAMNVIHCSKESGVKKLIFLGSSCIYPRDCPQPMQEQSLLTGRLEPTNEGYSLAKISGLKLCEYMNRQYGTNFISLMPCNVYGFNDHFEPKNSHVISALIFKFYEAKIDNIPSVEIWGTGVSRREFIFVDDLSDAIIYFMKGYNADGGPALINVGSGEDISIRDLAILIKSVVGYQGDVVFNSEKPDGMPKKLMDVSRARSLGWSTKINLETGVRLTYDWYVNQRQKSL